MKDMFKNVNDAGVIMMETILSLPIYIILLACVFYLGELCLSRLTLTHGERLRLWESGLRHSPTPVADRDIFYFSNLGNTFINTSSFSTVNSFSSTSSSNGWGQIRTGKASLQTQRSLWSWGANVSAENTTSYGSSTTPARNTMLMSSRDRDNAGNWSNVQLFSRTASTGRTNLYFTDDQRDDKEWLAIYQGKWKSFGPSGQSATTLSLYDRINTFYLNWSK